MASYSNPQLRDALAAEYVIGTLRGRARARFESLARYDPALRRLVAEWEARLTPLAVAAPEVAPSPRVWASLSRRVAGARATGWWASAALWRGIAAAATTFTVVLAAVLALQPAPQAPMAMVAVMSDDQGQPALVVSWPPMKAMRDPHVRVKVVQAHPVMDAGTAWEMWMLPGENAAPVSMGLITTDRDQVMKIPPALAQRMGNAWGVAMSVEPAGGSKTGAPSGPVIFKGKCVKMI
jgi:anti-sigma-K factor RskA